jgi:uncharacterized protein DUF1937
VSYHYLATPYTKYPAGHDAAAADAAVQATILHEAGIPVFSPIVVGHAIHRYMPANVPRDGLFWIDFMRPFMDAARGLIVCRLESWEESYGIRVEVEIFQEAGKPIVYMEPGGVPDGLASSPVGDEDAIFHTRDRDARVVPVAWPGCTDLNAVRRAREIWDHSANDSAYHAERLIKTGVSINIVKRILMPYL